MELAKHVKLNCPNLVFSGLMTIGMLDYSSTPENFKVKYSIFWDAEIVYEWQYGMHMCAYVC
jgi:hypothetical protein